jgi:hypothetical protein
VEFGSQRNNRKILLFLDSCSSHKITFETSNIELLFLPKKAHQNFNHWMLE